MEAEHVSSYRATGHEIDAALQRGAGLGGSCRRATQRPYRQVGHGGAPDAARGSEAG